VETHNYRVVLDTNQVIAAGSRWLVTGTPSPDKNTSRRILLRVAASHTGLYCGKILGEYLEKLVERRHPKERVVQLIAYIMGAFTEVEVSTACAPFRPTDPDDEIFLLCAIDGNADVLVSNDHSLINLKSSYTKPAIGTDEDLAKLLGA
jgi:predicted nucleic acid-binding protein